MDRKKFSEAVEAHRISMGLGQKEFGNLFGTSQQVVAGWERGSIPNPKILVGVCEMLRLDVSEVSKLRAKRKRKTTPHGVTIKKDSMKQSQKISEIEIGTSVPIISWIQAGDWQEINDQFEPGDADDFILVCRNISKHTFALRIEGDSMEPEFSQGDFIIVDPAVQPETGRYVVAKTNNGNGNNGEATFKQFVRDGNSVFLRPLNDKYPLMDMTGKKFKIVGCVVQKTKEY